MKACHYALISQAGIHFQCVTKFSWLHISNLSQPCLLIGMLISTASAQVLINFCLDWSSSLPISQKSLTLFCKPQLENYLWKTSHTKYSKKTFKQLILLRKLSFALRINVFIEECKDMCRVSIPKQDTKCNNCWWHGFLFVSLFICFRFSTYLDSS